MLQESETAEQAEALVNTLQLDGTNLNDANLGTLSSSDLEQLAHLQAELDSINAAELDGAEIGEEVIIETEYKEDEDTVEEPLVQVAENKETPPPLRPLTIAPKPLKIQQQQQIVLIQSPGGTTSTVNLGGQQIKLLSTQGQPMLQNLQLTKPPVLVTQQQLKGAIKKIIPQSPATNKNLVTKMLPANAKTITLAQAQQMGLISGGKVQQIIPQSPPGKQQTLIVNKQTIKVMPQIKSPTKILPAPTSTSIGKPASLQRVIIKKGGAQLKTAQSGGVSQVIRLPAGQPTNAGQIHQINVPGKGVQYIRFMPTTQAQTTTTTVATPKQMQKAQVVPVAGISVQRATPTAANKNTMQNVIKVLPLSTSQTRPVAPKPIQTQRVLIPAVSSCNPTQQITTISASALSQILPGVSGIPGLPGASAGGVVMLPAQYVQQLSQKKPPPAPPTVPSVTIKKEPPPPPPLKEEVQEEPEVHRALEPNGIRPRKPCNCTKSLCLKLYCDCFANGEFCHLCNCMNCYNNLDHEEERSRAIRNCLERNPNAFRPKIGKGKDSSEASIRKHTKGCNCKRSGCLKNYCECYEAKIACSNNCKCVGCRNIEDSMEKKNIRPMSAVSISAQAHDAQVVPQKKLNVPHQTDLTLFRPLIQNTSNKSPSTYMTNDVIEATTQCLIARAEEAERSMCPDDVATRMILEEFGRCLVEIINCAKNASNN